MTRRIATLLLTALLAAWCAPVWADEARDGTLTTDGGGSATFTGSGTVDLTRASSSSGGYMSIGDFADFQTTTDFSVVWYGNLDDIDGQLLEYIFSKTDGGGWTVGVNGTYTSGCSGGGDNVVFLFDQDGTGIVCAGPATSLSNDTNYPITLTVESDGDAFLCVNATCGTPTATSLTESDDQTVEPGIADTLTPSEAFAPLPALVRSETAGLTENLSTLQPTPVSGRIIWRSTP